MQALVHREPAVAAAHRIAGLVDASDGRFSIGLAGGSTPAAMYEVLKRLEIDWSRVDLWLSDERWVPWDDERSNGRMALETLVNQVDIELHRPEWNENTSPAESAARYETTLRALFDGRPDLVLLGMGADGHTASLFPNSAALDEKERWYVANEIPETGEERLTVTYPLLRSARHLLVLAVGESKAAAVRDSFAGLTPAGRISANDVATEWFLDADAASLLS